MCSVPEMSKRAYGISSGRASGMSAFCGSMFTTGSFGTPDGTSRCTTGHRRNSATTSIRGSGLTTTGCFTAASIGWS